MSFYEDRVTRFDLRDGTKSERDDIMLLEKIGFGNGDAAIVEIHGDGDVFAVAKLVPKCFEWLASLYAIDKNEAVGMQVSRYPFDELLSRGFWVHDRALFCCEWVAVEDEHIE